MSDETTYTSASVHPRGEATVKPILRALPTESVALSWECAGLHVRQYVRGNTRLAIDPQDQHTDATVHLSVEQAEKLLERLTMWKKQRGHST